MGAAIMEWPVMAGPKKMLLGRPFIVWVVLIMETSRRRGGLEMGREPGVVG